MKSYTVKIFKNGAHVDTQIVTAADEGKAQSAAMAITRVRFMGALASYEVTCND